MAMHPAIREMLNRYELDTKNDYRNALKEIIQEVTLSGLARQHFFDKAAFYGGTALRIAHGLDRFSEDLDFERIKNAGDIKLENYLQGIDDELKTFGLNLKSEKKIKTVKSTVDSAFVKGNTLEHLLMIEGIDDPNSGINKNEMIKIKLEIDLDPPEISSNTEVIFHEFPIPFAFRILDLPSLFGGKLHAVLCRQWKGERIKGRDFYDFLWYVRKKITPNLSYLESKMRQSGNWNQDELSMGSLKTLLEKKFDTTNWELAKSDVVPFIKDTRVLDVWSKDFFKTMAKKIS